MLAGPCWVDAKLFGSASWALQLHRLPLPLLQGSLQRNFIASLLGEQFVLQVHGEALLLVEFNGNNLAVSDVNLLDEPAINLDLLVVVEHVPNPEIVACSNQIRHRTVEEFIL